jgi:hypothetical protein
MSHESNEPKNCPHGVTLKSYRFDVNAGAAAYSREAGIKQFACLSADGCPGCLEERVSKLRSAMELLLYSVDVPNDARRFDYERAVDAFMDDLKKWIGPSYRPVERPRSRPAGIAQ